MFPHTDIQHENMQLNIISNIIAFVIGFTATITTAHNFYSHFSSDLITILSNPDTYSFFFKSIIGGIISLAVKVGGDWIINYFKERKGE